MNLASENPPIREKLNVISIQYLRAVAAIGIVVFHFGERFNYHLDFLTPGVDLFFLISGFIMWMVTRKEEKSSQLFLLKRLIRIVPMYWIFTAIVALGATLKPNIFPLDHPTFDHTVLSLFFIPHMGPDGKWFPLLVQGWTLNFEIFFYLIFFVGLSVFKKQQFLFLNVTIFAILLIDYVMTSHYSESWRIVYNPSLLLEFLSGIYICRAFLNKKTLNVWLASLAILSGVLLIALKFILNETEIPRIICVGIPAALIVYGAVSLESHRAIKSFKPFLLLGDASYSIYLSHSLSLVGISIVAVKLGMAVSPDMIWWGSLISIAVGTIIHLTVEKPIGRFLQRLISHPKKEAAIQINVT